MAKLLKLRRGTTSQHSSFTGADGEVTVDTNKETLVVHNGSQAGGFPLLRQDLSNLPAGTIDNSDVNSSAAIAGTKISPNFGSQVVQTTGSFGCGSATVDRLVVEDDGSSSPLVLIKADDGNPWAFHVRNDSFSTSDTVGFRMFQQNNGTMDLRTSGSGSFLPVQFKQDDASSTRTIWESDTSGAFKAGYGGTTKFQTTNNGATFTGTSVNTLTIDGTGNHELYSYHDSGGVGWATGAGGSFGELLYLDEGNSTLRLYTGGNERLRAKDGGVKVTGLLEVSSSLNLTGTLTGDRAIFQDDGQAGPTVSIMTDDNSPWALSIGNDTYSNQSHKGLMFYQNNNGDMYQHYRGDGAYEGIYFQTSNGSQTENFMSVDSTRSVHLMHQANTKLSTASTGVVVNSTNDFRIAAGTWAGEYSGGIKIQPDPSNSYFQFQGVLFFRDATGANRFNIQQNGIVGVGNHIRPSADASYDLGSSTHRFRDVYTNDLHLSNEGHSNDVDGSWGNWTIQEGESDLFLKNNRSGKKYKFNLTEVS
tara:strand:- start:829 stop:2424 length:1596 start_codon:yes stop_codon:yes gene_type:complete